MQTILKRKKFLPEIPDLIPVRETVARAKQVLGYQPWALAFEDGKIDAEKIERKVAETLESLGIEPLDLALVKKYQEEEVRKIERRGASKFVKRMHANLGKILVKSLGILGFGGVAVILFVIGAVDAENGPLPPGMAQYFFCALGADLVFFLAWTILMIARHKPVEIYSASWPIKPIEYYNQPIPEFALLRAMEIKSSLPDARFGIEEIQQQTQNVRMMEAIPLLDPFLVLLYGHMKLYVDVWDEPRFEGRRTI